MTSTRTLPAFISHQCKSISGRNVDKAPNNTVLIWAIQEHGSVAVEFGMILPILTVMLMGIVAYGGCFWISHSVQQVANDAARAAVGGLSSSERFSLAQQCMSTDMLTYPNLTPTLANVSESEKGQAITVSVSYDASSSIFWALGGLVPMPSAMIVRQATIQLGGY